MLTNEKVLKVFSDYISKDPDYEVVMTSHGYTVLCWNSISEEWLGAQYCKTPQDLMNALLDSYESYLCDIITHSSRDLTDQEAKEVQDKLNSKRKKCEAE